MKKQMGRPPEYRQRIVFTTNVESDIKQEFQQTAREERYSMAEALQEAMRNWIEEKKGIGTDNPLNIHYNGSNKHFKQVPLTMFLKPIDTDKLVKEMKEANIDLSKVHANFKNMAESVNYVVYGKRRL